MGIVEVTPATVQVDSKTYPLATDKGGHPIWEVQSGQRLEKEFGFGGAMGETRCIHPGVCDGCYFAEGFDYTDGTLRLSPGITTVGARYTGTFDGAGGAGGTVLTDAAGGFPTTGDGIKGYTVTILAGTGAGGARTISANDATTVTVAAITIDATSTYDISVLGSLAYTPLTMFEEFDSTGTGADYVLFRDTTTTPDIISKKIRRSDDTPIDTKNFGETNLTAPRLGRTEVFLSKTYVPGGDGSGSRVLQKLATVGAISTETADTWESADAGVFGYAFASVLVDGTLKFVRGFSGKIGLTAVEPKTSASYETQLTVGPDPIMWISEMSDGLIGVHSSTNFLLWDSDGNAYPVLPGTRHAAQLITAQEAAGSSNTYDDFDGHMGDSLSAGALHPARNGFWFYENGLVQNF